MRLTLWHAPLFLLLATPTPVTRDAVRGLAGSTEPTISASQRQFEGGSPPSSLDPRRPLTARSQRWVDSTFRSLSPRARAAQLIHVWLLGDYESASDSAYATTARWVKDDGIGGILMSVGTPIEVAAKLNALQRLARVPLLVGCDVEPSIGRLEGGLFIPSMLRGGSATIIPSNMAIAATGDTALAYRAGYVTGIESRAIGIHLAYAPVADINNNASNPVINVRSFGENAEQVARMTAAFTRGVQDGGTLATVKHFPGHGDTETDSHNALPVVRLTHARLDSVEFRPFRAAINAGAAAVMSAHISNPTWLGDDLPATLQRRVLHDELRDSMQFRGLIVTDALTMQGVAKMFSQEEIAIRSVEAGAEVLLKPADVEPVLNALAAKAARDPAFARLIDRAARKNLEMKARVGLSESKQVSLEHLRDVVGSTPNRAVSSEIAARAITLLRDSSRLVPMRTAAQGPLSVVIYTPETEFGGGTAFADEVRKYTAANVARVGPSTTRATLDALAASATTGRLVILTVVRRVEGRGRTAIADGFAAWIQEIAPRLHPVVIAAGNPYVLDQFPSVDAYLATFSVGELPERAAARALMGRNAITGRAPVSLPSRYARGDGLQREVVR
jgi:beta-N-acetylhexosaminidase